MGWGHYLTIMYILLVIGMTCIESNSHSIHIFNESHLHGNVIVRKEKKTSYAEFVKENSSGRTEENKEPLDTGYNWI